MVVGIDLVHWGAVAPSNSLVPEPVKGALGHCAVVAGVAKMNEQEKCDRGQKHG